MKTERNKEIYEKYKKGGVSYGDLAEEYGVRSSRIGQIIQQEKKLEQGVPIKIKIKK